MPDHRAMTQRSCRSAATTLRHPDRAVAELASTQRGVVTRAQLVAAGLSPSGISRRVAAGRLHRLHLGVYAVGHTALPFAARAQAGTLACGSRAALSHWSAAAWLDVWPPRLPIHVTVPGGRGRGQDGLVVHDGSLSPEDVVRRGGLRQTTWARTMLDISAAADLEVVVGLLDRSAARRLADTRPILDVLARNPGRNGAGRLRQALLIVHPQGVLTRSELERRGLRMMRRHRLPTPEVNARLRGYEVDFLWRSQGLVLELDGGRWHSTATDRERDTRKAANLMAGGWTVLRLTWRQVVHDQAWAASRIAGTLRSRVAA